MINALWITLIGMGLVFVAILLLWGLMALLVRVTAAAEPEQSAVVEEVYPAAALELGGSQDCKRQAAAAAVAFALALEQQSRSTVSNHRAVPAAGVSAWQAVNRSQQISQRINTRKKETR